MMVLLASTPTTIVSLVCGTVADKPPAKTLVKYTLHQAGLHSSAEFLLQPDTATAQHLSNWTMGHTAADARTSHTTTSTIKGSTAYSCSSSSTCPGCCNAFDHC